MSVDTENLENPETKQGVIRYVIRYIVFILIQAACLFLSAKSLDWLNAWVYLGVITVNQAIVVLILLRTSPDLLGERTRTHDDAKRWDRPLAAFMGLWGTLIILIVAGLDFRLGWSSPLATWIQIIAFVFMILASCLTIWALAANKFFSGYVRIQRERNHTVARTGPYKFVRHPGYLGALIFYLAGPVLLDSLWALLPAGFYVVVVVFRTSMEDRTLQEELDGYLAYTQDVRYRLIPGIW